METLQNEILCFNISGFSVFIAIWFYAISWLNNKLTLLKKLGSFFLFISLISLTVALVFRGIALHFFPLTNLYESLVIFAWAVIAAYLFLEWKFKINSFGWIVSAFLLIVFLYASWLPPGQKQIAPLIPALQSYWRTIHVPPLLMSYALFLIGAFSSIGYLFETKFFNKSKEGKEGIRTTKETANGVKINSYVREISEKAYFFDEVTYRCVTFGFPLLTIGIITGALWANHAWGALWQWDPKETMALVTWFIYAAYLHLRLNTKVSGSILALISLIGIAMVYLTYLGVNQFNFGGLHTYGKIE
ncbi:MAG: c-type cytochrome biogenesis protein CcsB [Candidatus Melainabacteria bacterium RIFCSPLOWO2_02_FULL_35_15]|nr:MAG: c-type cytochrome biogenesis protein CcsB [Candidatus Melainabacteria bacterium RIFCSPLOWO2_12_FULL_35_11]OGI13489.1 MAG: c-type cytochrome biogenesis protein CcsB [Candidatus Melainabacteria bacterium RIFCSPLOWO2_02_FULL_35_15]